MTTGLNTQELTTLLQSLQSTLEEGGLKANLLRKQERFQAAQEVLVSASAELTLQPVQSLLDRITKVCFTNTGSK